MVQAIVVRKVDDVEIIRIDRDNVMQVNLTDHAVEPEVQREIEKFLDVRTDTGKVTLSTEGYLTVPYNTAGLTATKRDAFREKMKLTIQKTVFHKLSHQNDTIDLNDSTMLVSTTAT